jgi:hypothetical protein
MISSSDWDDALEMFAESERQRLGGSPTSVEVRRYLRGELAEPDASRVRALMIYDPALTPLLRQRTSGPSRRPSWTLALAASATIIAMVLSVLLVHSTRRVSELEQLALRPTLHSSRHEFAPMRTRGGGGATIRKLQAGEERYLLVAFVADETHDSAGTYQIDIVRDNGSPMTLWRISQARPEEGAFDISVPGALLTPGDYRIEIRSNHDGEVRLVESYAFSVDAPP